MNCKDCKYYYKLQRRTLCGGVSGVMDEGKCSNIFMTDDSRNDNGVCPDNGIYSTCDESRGDLIVGENFGCIHFEKRNNEHTT